jgi:hypothetical protein
MFRSMAGFKTQYHYLTLMVISEFNEWRVLLHSPTTAIHGTRQFSDAKAKEHAVAIAQKYIHEYKQEELPVLTDIEWVPTSQDDWLVWMS